MVSIPYRFNERKKEADTLKEVANVSIPYRFNERRGTVTNVMDKTTFQFLIGSMKGRSGNNNGTNEFVSIPYRFNERLDTITTNLPAN